MKKTSEPIVFFGNERLATGVTTSAPTLLSLIDAGYDVVSVVTNYSEATSRNTRQLEIKAIADKHGIPVLIPENLTDIKKSLEALGAKCAVLVAYGKIVPQEIIDLFPLGIINVHPSLLPKHRGPTPLESVILDGSTSSGVSVMQLARAMDAGPVYAQDESPLKGIETKQELADMFGLLGSKMIIKHLPAILSGELKPTPQNDSDATYDSLITKLDGAIDWNLSAEQIERQIRAYANWPGSRAEIFGKDVIVLESQVAEETGVPGEVLVQEKQLFICCGSKAINILRLKPAGKQEMPADAFLAGYSNKL